MDFLKQFFLIMLFWNIYIPFYNFFFNFFEKLITMFNFCKKNTKKKMRENIIAMFGSRKVLRKEKNVKKNYFFIFGFMKFFLKKIKYN